MSLTTRVLAALLAGMAAGVLIARSGSPTLAAIAVAIEPVGTLFINAIRMTVIPLVVGNLIVGVTSGADTRSIGRIGGRALIFFGITLVLGATFAAIAAPPLLALLPIDPATAAGLRSGAAEAATTVGRSAAELPTFAQWLVSLVPSNPVKAAADGAMLPLIIFSLLFGLAITRIAGDRRATLVRAFQGVAEASLTLVRWILHLAPIGVFALVLPLAVRMGASAAGAVAGYIAVVALTTVAFALLVLYPVAVLLGRVSLGTFARATLPAQAVAFSARSSLAALPAMIEAARFRLRLPEDVTSFFLPLAASTYRVGGAVGQTVGVLFLARLYGVDLGPTQLASIVATVVLTTFSVPGVPGGSILVMVPVLLAAGVPVEGVGILLGVDAIPDMFRTTGNVTGDMAAATVLSAGERADVRTVAEQVA